MNKISSSAQPLFSLHNQFFLMVFICLYFFPYNLFTIQSLAFYFPFPLFHWNISGKSHQRTNWPVAKCCDLSQSSPSFTCLQRFPQWIPLFDLFSSPVVMTLFSPVLWSCCPFTSFLKCWCFEGHLPEHPCSSFSFLHSLIGPVSSCVFSCHPSANGPLLPTVLLSSRSVAPAADWTPPPYFPHRLVFFVASGREPTRSSLCRKGKLIIKIERVS